MRTMRDQLPQKLPSDPMHWADAWLKEAEATKAQRNPNSMTVATVDGDGQPAARIVLCKAFVPDPGYVVFYTNYESQKASQLLRHPQCATLFHWDSIGRQVRLEGVAIKSPAVESDAYFATRDWGSQLGAWGSDQSRTIASKEALIRQIRERGTKLGLSFADDTRSLVEACPKTISRPPHWGGFRIWPQAIELWVEGKDRIHDRARWTRNLTRLGEDDFATTAWHGTRLQP